MYVLDNGLPGRLARGTGDSFMAQETVLYGRVGTDRRGLLSTGSSDPEGGGVMTTKDKTHGTPSPGSPHLQAQKETTRW